jgi:hypothetical protein
MITANRYRIERRDKSGSLVYPMHEVGNETEAHNIWREMLSDTSNHGRGWDIRIVLRQEGFTKKSWKVRQIGPERIIPGTLQSL